MKKMHPFTLKFADQENELSYCGSSLDRDRHQGRAAIIVGVIVYLLYGLLDVWHVPEETRTTIWEIRLSALTVPLAVYILSYKQLFKAHRHLLLSLVGFAAGVGLITMLAHLPMDSSSVFYPGLVLATFYTYNFIGTRFVYAFCVDIALLFGYNIVFGGFHDYPMHVLISHDFFIVSANLIGGVAGYLNEKQKRMLFIRERELDEERHEHLIRSLHDPLTGLPNRELLYDRLRHALASAEREKVTHCGFFIDLDGFKEVNDRLGHEAGDEVISQIAQRLRSVVRESDTVARMGGDEFFFLAYGIRTQTEAFALANKLITSISSPMSGISADIPLGASVGICMFPYPGMSDISEIIKRADHAMYQAKIGGKGKYVLYTDNPEVQFAT